MSITTAQPFYSNLIITSLMIFLSTAVMLLDLIKRASEPLSDVVNKALRI
jgi:multisubunit Na+/H+ antiporter MnhC subunit